MANGVFNVALGRVNEYVSRVVSNEPTNAAIVVVVLKVVESDSTLRDYDTLAALLAGSNTEADFTNYARIVLTDSDLSVPTVDDTEDNQTAGIDDPEWADAGGALNNDVEKLLFCYDADTTAGDDSNIIPLTFHDFVATTDGGTLIASYDAGYFFGASE